MDIHTPWVRLTDFGRSRGNRPLRPRRHHGFRPRSGLFKGVGGQFHGRFQKLKAKAEQGAADSRIEYQKQIENMQEKHKKVEKKVKEVREAGGSAWEDLKSGVQSAWEVMEEAVKSARSKFK